MTKDTTAQEKTGRLWWHLTGDDMQWKSTYEDDATHVTHYQKLREMPQIGGNAEYS